MDNLLEMLKMHLGCPIETVWRNWEVTLKNWCTKI